MMKLSMAMASFEDYDTLDDLEGRLGQIRSWGYDAVEPMICRPRNIDVHGTLALLKRLGLAVSGFRTGSGYVVDRLSLSDPDPGVRERAVRRLKHGLDLSASYPGASLISGLMQGPLQEGVTLPQARQWIVAAVADCCRHAEEVGVTFCLEPVNRYELGYHRTVASIASIGKDVGSPRFKILIDTFHMNIEEADPAGSIREYGKHIGGVHFVDSNRAAPGTGHLDFPDLLAALREAGYDGYLTMEMAPEYDTEQNARKAVSFLRVLE